MHFPRVCQLVKVLAGKYLHGDVVKNILFQCETRGAREVSSSSIQQANRNNFHGTDWIQEAEAAK